MIINVETNSLNTKNSSLEYILTFLLGIALNQTSILFGINTSISDLFLLFLLFRFILNGKLIFTKRETIFFLVLSVSVLISSTFVSPIFLGIRPTIIAILSDYLKIIISFLYVVLGYNIAIKNLDKILLKSQAGFAVIIAIIGLLASTITIPIVGEALFFGDFRLKGLLNDPNLFAVVQLMALSYFLKQNQINNKKRIFSIIFLIISVLLSASKTGLISIVVIVTIHLIQYALFKKKNIKQLINVLILCLISVIIVPYLINYFMKFVPNLIIKYPSLDRISVLFTNFSSAISGSGSERSIVWENALKIISLFPFTGVGVGTYIDISKKITGIGLVAHNTYLQLYAEWGIILTTIFFMYIFLLLWRSFFLLKKDLVINIVSSSIIAILIGSIAISLNNARFFWLYLGILVYHATLKIK